MQTGQNEKKKEQHIYIAILFAAPKQKNLTLKSVNFISFSDSLDFSMSSPFL